MIEPTSFFDQGNRIIPLQGNLVLQILGISSLHPQDRIVFVPPIEASNVVMLPPALPLILPVSLPVPESDRQDPPLQQEQEQEQDKNKNKSQQEESDDPIQRMGLRERNRNIKNNEQRAEQKQKQKQKQKQNSQ
jgi:type IV secretory pathway VirB10-like protein